MWHPIKHFILITKHRHKVIKYCFKAGIGLQGLKHDLSKYSLTEFIVGMKYYSGKRSPNAVEIEKYGYSKAWLHHSGRNKHHFEYWVDYDKVSGSFKPIKMPLRYVKEMFCDRVAATKIYQKKAYNDSSALEYFISRNEDNALHKDTRELLVSWLTLLKDKGEKETFKIVKNTKKY